MTDMTELLALLDQLAPLSTELKTHFMSENIQALEPVTAFSLPDLVYGSYRAG